MIELSTTTALMLYLVAALVPVVVLWMSYHVKSRHKKIDTAEKNLCVCEFCHYCYLQNKSSSVSQCPQCNSFNKGDEAG